MVQDQQDNPFKKVFDHAVKLLSNRLHTREELRRKLLLRKYDKSLIEQALDRLAELRVLNDEQFAEVFLQNLIHYKNFGFYGLKMKLRQRGLENNLIERLLADFSVEDELEIGRRAIARKAGDTEKIIRTLKSKGFRSEVINKLIKKEAHD